MLLSHVQTILGTMFTAKTMKKYCRLSSSKLETHVTTCSKFNEEVRCTAWLAAFDEQTVMDIDGTKFCSCLSMQSVSKLHRKVIKIVIAIHQIVYNTYKCSKSLWSLHTIKILVFYF